MQGIGTEFEEAAKLARRRGRPEREFLHEGGLFVSDQLFQLAVEF